MAIRELESGGKAVRIACGRIILRMICRYDMPDTVAGFELACRNGFQGRTHRLGTVGALIQGKDENCRRKRIDQNTGARKSVKHNEKLDQKRGFRGKSKI